MEALLLRRPAQADETAIWAYRQAFLDIGESTDGTAGLGENVTFADWFARLEDNSAPETVRPGLVPETTLVALRHSDGRLVGFIDIRHTLNDHLLQYGGHIGYSVHPMERRQGYATEMLRQALCFCRTKLGLKRVLVTCDKTNAPSRRTILANGGVLEDERDQDGELVQRYWIDLNP